ncbi:MAG: O-methyltransferase [Bacteroidota bacterium]|nr:O-methyltransferase [Bacteroidota bacterium]
MDTLIFEKVDVYISNMFAPDDATLAATLRSLRAEGLPQHSVSANQGKFLQLMAILCNAKKILELGTLGGYSTIWLARALPADGKLISVEINNHYAEVAQRNINDAGLSGKVEIRVGDALEILPKMIHDKEGPFDLVFVDADKPPYAEYFSFALSLARPGTLLVFDNVIREGKILDPATTDEKVKGVQRFNKILSDNPHVTSTILPIVGIKEYDGMALAIVKGNIIA